MSWRPVARQEAMLLLDSEAVAYLHTVLVLAVVLAAYVYPMTAPEPYTTARFGGFATGALVVLVPLVGILVGYNAVAGDRESGSLLLSLSLPISRRDLVLGAFAGRFGVLAAALVGAMVVAGALVVYPFGELALARFVAFVLLTLAFGAVWTGLGLAVSVSVATRQRAMVLGFGLVFAFVLAWDAVPWALQTLLDELGAIDGELPEPALFVVDLSPGNAFERVTAGFVDTGATVEGPWYRSPWASLAVLAGWAVLPLGLAFRRFDASDLP